jgi:hypothetical protein
MKIGLIKSALIDDNGSSIRNLSPLLGYKNKIAPFIGAGMSVSSGYSTWYGFLIAQLRRLLKDD